MSIYISNSSLSTRKSNSTLNIWMKITFLLCFFQRVKCGNSKACWVVNFLHKIQFSFIIFSSCGLVVWLYNSKANISSRTDTHTHTHSIRTHEIPAIELTWIHTKNVCSFVWELRDEVENFEYHSCCFTKKIFSFSKISLTILAWYTLKCTSCVWWNKWKSIFENE